MNSDSKRPKYCFLNIEQSVQHTRYNGGKIINYKLPKTGDPADLWLWTGMALMGLGVACGAVMIGRRKKAQR